MRVRQTTETKPPTIFVHRRIPPSRFYHDIKSTHEYDVEDYLINQI